MSASMSNLESFARQNENCWVWLPQDRHLLERPHLDADLFRKFAHEGDGRTLVSLAMSTDDVPHPGVARPVLRALGQQERVFPHQKASGTNSHGLLRRYVSCGLYI